MDFKNTLIIMTSNVGSSVIEKGGGGLGFQLDTSEEDSSYNRIKTLVNEELKQYFRPEFLNRYVLNLCMLLHVVQICRMVFVLCSTNCECVVKMASVVLRCRLPCVCHAASNYANCWYAVQLIMYMCIKCCDSVE